MPKFSMIWWIPPYSTYLVKLASRRSHHMVFEYHAWSQVLAKCGKGDDEWGFYTMNAIKKIGNFGSRYTR